MIGLDTNILVRLAIEDDPVQLQKARDFLDANCSAGDPGFVNRITLCEMVWVLTSNYGLRRAEIARHIAALIASTDIVIEDADAVRAAVPRYAHSNIGFADLLIAETNLAAGCKATATFDRRAAKLDGFMAMP
jgi:predicted nucleic-acid-binding protein